MLQQFNCSPKFDQKVKIPTRSQIRNICKDLDTLVIDRIFPVNTFIELVGNFISHRFRVNVLHAIASQVDPGEVDINAHYDSERDDSCNIPIDLILVTNPQDLCVIFDREEFDVFVTHLADTLAHELIHMRQSRARNHLQLEYKIVDSDALDFTATYLKDPDEIDAFAYGIAVELKDLPNHFKLLTNPKNITVKDSPNLWVYINTFSKEKNNVTLKKLFKKIYKYLT